MVDTKEFIELQQGTKSNKRGCKIATVVELFDAGTAKIMFKGEDIASEKEYSYLASYAPVVGDAVLLLPFLDTYIIIGKVLYKETESREQYVSVDALDTILSNYLTSNDLTNYVTTDVLTGYATKEDLGDYYKSGSTIVANNLRHHGASLGFFGYYSGRQYVSTVSSTAELAAVRTKLNELINALDTYGLV